MVDRERFPAKSGESRARIRERVHANPEPRDSVAARDSDHAEGQNNNDARRVVFQKHSEIEDDYRGDKNFEQQYEFALGDEVSFASFIDELGDFAHRAVYGEILQAHINREAENQAKDAEHNSEEQKLMAIHAKKLHLREIR